jgi:hypothetical protein
MYQPSTAPKKKVCAVNWTIGLADIRARGAEAAEDKRKDAPWTTASTTWG